MNKTQARFTLLRLSLVVAGSLCGLLQNADAQPITIRAEAPSIVRQVWERKLDGSNPVTYDHPRLPPFHTTSDGRLAVDIKPHGSGTNTKVYWNLFVPEKLTGPFVSATASSTLLLADHTGKSVTLVDGTSSQISLSAPDVRIPAATFTSLISAASSPWSAGTVRHVTIIDKTREFTDGSPQNNPQLVGGKDVYKFVVHATAEYTGSGSAVAVKHQFTNVTVTVLNPKTPSAVIETIEIGTKTCSAGYISGISTILEPRFTHDGKLFVCRTAGTNNLNYYAPDTGALTTASYADVVYAFSSDGSLDGVNNTVDGFDNLIPISYAPYDPRINGTRNQAGDVFYGFAAFPFRDGSGNLIKKGIDMDVSYPWLDTDARTLAFTTLNQFLNGVSTTSFPNGDLSNRKSYANEAVTGSGTLIVDEPVNHFQGESLVGLWTQGKIITPDNRLNNTDFPLGQTREHHRMVTLYQPNASAGPTDPLDQTNPTYVSGKIRVGSGRSNGGTDPVLDAGNTDFFDSIENKLNYNENMKTTIPRDVVWWITNGVATAQFAFDDYLNKNSFIISKMNGALELKYDNNTTPTIGTLKYLNGWYDGGTATRSDDSWTWPNGTTPVIAVANDATAVGSSMSGTIPDYIAPNSRSFTAKWNIPANGVMKGTGVRIEPIAHGGIEGKGAWLDYDNGIEYTIPAQPGGDAAVKSSPWYIGVFVDSRVDDTTERELITFPDGSSITLTRRDTLQYRNAGGTLLKQFNLPDCVNSVPQWNRNQWRHLAFQYHYDTALNETYVDFYYNGFLAHSDTLTEIAFLITSTGSGKLTLGNTAASAPGYKGWYDDFVVFAQAFDAESCANHARGTLVKFTKDDPNAATMQARADLYAATGAGGEDDIKNTLYHTGQIDPAVLAQTRIAVWYDYTTDRGADLKNIPTAYATSIRHEILFPESPLFHDASRPDSIGNPFCFTCHDSTNPWNGMTLNALTLNNQVLAPNDTRRQPTQPLRRIFGAIPSGLGMNGNTASSTDSAAVLIDNYVLGSKSTPAREVRSFSLVHTDTKFEYTLESSTGVDSSVHSPYTLRANLDAGQGSVKFEVKRTFNQTVAYTSTLDQAPYAIFGSSVVNNAVVLTSGALPNGTYDITATPYANAGGAGAQGTPRTITNVVFSGGVDPLPAAPGGLSATATSSSTINLSWNDNSSNETSFSLERKIGAGGTYTTVTTIVSAGAGTGVITYGDTGLAASTAYTYRVKASNDDGSSAYSNEYTVTTSSASLSIINDDFESGTTVNPSLWDLSVVSADLYTGTNSPSGSGKSVHLESLDGSLTTKELVGLAGSSYTKLTVSLDYKYVSMPNNKGFDLKISTTQGPAYVTVTADGPVNRSSTITNGSKWSAVYHINAPAGYAFDANTRLRFICTGLDSSDDVYLDNIVITAQP